MARRWLRSSRTAGNDDDERRVQRKKMKEILRSRGPALDLGAAGDAADDDGADGLGHWRREGRWPRNRAATATAAFEHVQIEEGERRGRRMGI
jgi:hypothetical protein